ncbi:1-phosphofructokinase [Bacillus sp. CGMCC 1.16607]|uniref:1-phosphofructokinase n=1 Tax=Bacillus sp. CGMCC 1.16607 TaxID=3351842 RepID=UPI003625DD45
MITTITLNAALDKTYYLPKLSLGETNRLQQLHVEPGGKGVNVAKVLHTLGVNVCTSGFIGGSNGKRITQLLDERNISHDFIAIQGESRECLTIIDNEAKQETEILEVGPEISSDEWDRLCFHMKKIAKKSEMIILSGSLPLGVPDEGYGKLIDIIQQNGSKAILDTSGSALLYGIESAPFVIKPNEHELKQVLKKETITFQEAVEVGKTLIEKGIQNVCISFGKEGAVLITQNATYRVKVPPMNIVNTIGSGDSMLAGLAAGFYTNLPVEETLVLASACGAANALQPSAGRVELTEVRRLINQIEIIKMR